MVIAELFGIEDRFDFPDFLFDFLIACFAAEEVFELIVVEQDAEVFI